jgi:hypothetical protein
MLQRRSFLQMSGMAALSQLNLAAAAGDEVPPGLARPMRWAQLVFVEDDPGNYDPQFWLDYFKRIHADGACLGAGGYMAFYPSEIPLHYVSRYIKPGMDTFGELTAGCRKLGMSVIARTDPHACHDDVYRAHPDWIAVDADGKKRRHWAFPEAWVSCTLGPFSFDFMTAVTAEIARKYDVDGIFTNRWEGSGMCYCEHCTANFRKATGLELPRDNSPQSTKRAYEEWKENRLFEQWHLWDATIRKHRPNARFIANSGGGALSRIDMARLGKLSSILFADRQARNGAMPMWINGKYAKEYRAAMGSKPVGGIFSVGLEAPYRWKDSVQDAPELTAFVADGIANGIRPWFAKFNGKVIDKRWMEPVAKTYEWCWRNEKYLRNTESLARTAVVYSQRTARNYGTKVDDHINGYYQALIESRIPFEMAHDELLDAALPKYKLLILPNVAAMSDKQCEQIRQYVKNGGSIIATHETSLYDEHGKRRADFGLADVFGCSFAGEVIPRMQNAYLALNGPHALLNGIEGTPRIVHGVARVATKPHDAQAQSPLLYIPSYPDLPMEEVYPRAGQKPTQPEAYVRQFGAGRVVYFPFDLDRTYWEILATDHGRLLSNAATWALNGAPGVQVDGPGLLDVTVWRQENSIALHLVNLTNPMMMRGFVREPVPVGPQKVTLSLPAGLSAGKISLLESGGPVRDLAARNGTLTFTVPAVSVHEVVAIDLRGGGR